MNIPNLDAMDSDELMNFWSKHQHGRKTRDIFPDGGKGTKIATGSLAGYAVNKATAITCRERGDIQAALVYEKICDNIYQTLPEWSRW